jgi:Rrf2 family protein
MSNPLKFSEAANLALHACAFLAAGGGRMSAGRLAELMDVSQSHLAKVLQRLASEELLESTRGATGGFRLARPAEELTLLELVETVDGPLEEGGCLLGKPVCGRDSCLFTDLMQRTGSMVRRKLESVTLAEFTSEMPGFGRTGEREA